MRLPIEFGYRIYNTLIIVKILTSADQDTISAVMADVKILKAVLLANVQMDMNSATMVSNNFYSMICQFLFFIVCNTLVWRVFLFCWPEVSATGSRKIKIDSLTVARSTEKNLVKLGCCIFWIHNFSGFFLMHSLFRILGTVESQNSKFHQKVTEKWVSNFHFINSEKSGECY